MKKSLFYISLPIAVGIGIAYGLALGGFAAYLTAKDKFYSAKTKPSAKNGEFIPSDFLLNQEIRCLSRNNLEKSLDENILVLTE